MRIVEFKMERNGLVNVGDVVSISEIEGTVNYNYIIEHAAAMSGCFKVNERIISRQGKIIEIKTTDRGNYVVMEFDEDDPRA